MWDTVFSSRVPMTVILKGLFLVSILEAPLRLDVIQDLLQRFIFESSFKTVFGEGKQDQKSQGIINTIQGQIQRGGVHGIW